ncbi:MAG: tetratricopeptide repeat protein [Pirellulales bacterium]
MKRRADTLGPNHLSTLTAANNLGVYRLKHGETQDAVKRLEDVLKRYRETVPVDHPEALTTLDNLAQAYQAAGRREEAFERSREFLTLKRAKLAADDLEHAKLLQWFALRSRRIGPADRSDRRAT